MKERKVKTYWNIEESYEELFQKNNKELIQIMEELDEKLYEEKMGDDL